MIAGLDSSTPPNADQAALAKRNGVQFWSGYLRTRPAGIAHWEKPDFDRIKAAGLKSIAYCSGHDDPVACKAKAAEWKVRLCLDVEDGIRGNGSWVQAWLDASGAGLYGHADVHPGRRAAFHVLTHFVTNDPRASWEDGLARPPGPLAWQWREDGTNEYGVPVDRNWLDDSFAAGAGDHWVSTGGSFTRDPVVATNQDGRLELLVTGDDGHLRDLFQTAPGTWHDQWIDLGPPPGGGNGNPAVSRNKDGRLEVLLRATDGRIFHRGQDGPGGELKPWAPLPGEPRKRDPLLLSKPDGRLQAFVIGDDGHLLALEQKAPNGAWGAQWADLGGPPPGGAAGRLVARRHKDGRLALFLRGTNGKIFLRSQRRPGGALAKAWAPLSDAARHNDAVAAQNANGRLHAFVVADDDRLNGLCQKAPDGDFPARWTDHGPPPKSGPSGRLAVARNKDGRLELFVRGVDGHIYHRVQAKPGGAPNPPWNSLGGAFAGNPVVGQNHDGRLEVFAVGKDGAIHRGAQSAPGRWG